MMAGDLAMICAAVGGAIEMKLVITDNRVSQDLR
jgi:hypothetical protein